MKHTKKIKLLAGILALLAAGSALASCGEAAAPQTKDTQAPGTDAAAAETAAATETDYPMPAFPDKDYGGRDFTFITSDQNDDCGADWVTTDIYAANTTGDVITDAVYARNLWLEETFNVKIREFQSVSAEETRKAVAAGITDYDAVITAIANGCALGAENYVLDLKSVPYIDLTQSWWDQGVTAGTSIGGRTYIATGDITIVDNDATWVLMFNKQMAADLDYNFYQMVNDNKWDMETFYNCAKTAVKDLDGDGKITGAADQFGFATSDQSAQGLMYAAGAMLAQKDSSDYPVITSDISYLAKVVEKAGAIMSDPQTTIVAGKNGIKSTDELRFLFEGGRALFYGEVMQCVTRMRESTTDFGLIPFPKFETSQDRYYHHVIKIAGKGVCIPNTQPDPEMAGIIIEAMAARSVPTVTAAYYDKALTYKYMRDEESAKMLDIILSSRIYDLGYIYDWGGIYNTVFTLINSGKTDLASAWNKKLPAAEKALQKTVDAYRENE